MSPGTPAFTAAPTSYGTQPMGDVTVYVNNAGSGSFAQTVNQIFNSSYTTTFPKNTYPDWFENFNVSTASQGSNSSPSGGYYWVYSGVPPAAPSARNQYGNFQFSGFTTGPGYWGKTFFQWPPDPRASYDWRQLYFTDASNNPVVNNTTLWNSSSQTWNPPYGSSTNYHVNYKAILNWIKNIGPNPFPPMLQAGRIVYYTYIPTDVPAAAYDFSQPNSNITDTSQRFWKEYIDYCLGAYLDPFSNLQTPGSPTMSYGPDYNWGTVQITARPTGTPPNGSKLAYMNYNDNPPRPRHRMWFGPIDHAPVHRRHRDQPGDGSRHLDLLGQAGNRLGPPGRPAQPSQRQPRDDLLQSAPILRRAVDRQVLPGPVQPGHELLGDDDFALVSAQQHHGGRLALGLQRSPDAQLLRRFHPMHDDQSRPDAGLQPVSAARAPSAP